MIVRFITKVMMKLAGYKYEEPVPTFRTEGSRAGQRARE